MTRRIDHLLSVPAAATPTDPIREAQLARLQARFAPVADLFAYSPVARLIADRLSAIARSTATLAVLAGVPWSEARSTLAELRDVGVAEEIERGRWVLGRRFRGGGR